MTLSQSAEDRWYAGFECWRLCVDEVRGAMAARADDNQNRSDG